MKQEVRGYILDKHMIERGETVWAALSGGADSCCLIHMLNELKHELGFTLKAVHVNHMLRGVHSDADEAFCRSFCDGLGIKLLVISRDVRELAKEGKMTIEEAGRKARYEVFDSECDGKVALAHNMNDNAETLLMNLLRGSGMDGLGGIPEVSGKYIRPLLKTRRMDIEDYCLKNGLPYVNDETNEDMVFFRNAIRHRLLPVMDELTGKDVVPVIARAAELIRRDALFLSSEVDRLFSEMMTVDDERVSFSNDDVIRLAPVMMERLVRKAVEFVKGNLKDIESRNTGLLTELVKNNRTGDAVNLPGGINALVQFGKTIIYKDMSLSDYEYALPSHGTIYIKEKDLSITVSEADAAGKPDPKGNDHWFNFNECRGGFMVRNRRNGDIIKPWKGVGTVKLKKLFIDRKVERPGRDSLMLIACGNSVAYADGIALGRDFMPVEGEPMIQITIERGTGDV